MFEIKGQLGKGSYGSVVKCAIIGTQKIVAAKIMPIEEELESIINEVQILAHIEHPNIIQYYGVYNDIESHQVWIVMEYCVTNASSFMKKLRGDHHIFFLSKFFFDRILNCYKIIFLNRS